MAKGNPHKVHEGYRRSEVRMATLGLVSQAHAEMAADLDDIDYDDLTLDDIRIGFSFSAGEDFRELLDVLEDDDDDLALDYDFFELYEEPMFLIEDTWKDDDYYDVMDEGIGHLRYLMESVKPADIHLKDINWVAVKYTLLSAVVLGGLLSKEFFENEDEGMIFGRYMLALHNELSKAGIEFEVFGGVTEKGWGTIRGLTVFDCSENVNYAGVSVG